MNLDNAWSTISHIALEHEALKKQVHKMGGPLTLPATWSTLSMNWGGLIEK